MGTLMPNNKKISNYALFAEKLLHEDEKLQ